MHNKVKVSTPLWDGQQQSLLLIDNCCTCLFWSKSEMESEMESACTFKTLHTAYCRDDCTMNSAREFWNQLNSNVWPVNITVLFRRIWRFVENNRQCVPCKDWDDTSGLPSSTVCLTVRATSSCFSLHKFPTGKMGAELRAVTSRRQHICHD